jgi:hypothetical protein
MERANQIHREIGTDQNQGWGPAPYQYLLSIREHIADIASRKFMLARPAN